MLLTTIPTPIAMLASLLLAPLLALNAVAFTTNEGSICLDACASWSTTLEHCRNTFSDKGELQTCGLS